MRYIIKARTGINQADISKLENGTLNKMKIFQLLIHNKINQKSNRKKIRLFFCAFILNITPHVCRHTYCSNMAKARMNPKTLQYLMGHPITNVFVLN